VTSVTEASNLLRDLSLPWGSGETVKDVIDRTAKAAKLAFWRTSDLWYEKARRVDDAEIERIREALKEKNRKAAVNELRDLKFRIARLESALVSRDPDFHSPEIDFAGELLRGVGGMDSAGAAGGRRR
jgi:hypothetical protein